MSFYLRIFDLEHDAHYWTLYTMKSTLGNSHITWKIYISCIICIVWGCTTVRHSCYRESMITHKRGNLKRMSNLHKKIRKSSISLKISLHSIEKCLKLDRYYCRRGIHLSLNILMMFHSRLDKITVCAKNTRIASGVEECWSCTRADAIVWRRTNNFKLYIRDLI